MGWWSFGRVRAANTIRTARAAAIAQLFASAAASQRLGSRPQGPSALGRLRAPATMRPMRTSLADRRTLRRFVAAATGWWLLACLPAQVPAHATVLNPTTFQWRPTLVQQGDVVHAFAIGTTTLLHARSTDGGRTWPLREQALGQLATNTAPTGPHDVHVVARPGELIVLGHDVALGPQLVRSFDEGTTWGAPVPVTTTVALQANAMLPAMCVDGATIVVAWTNNRPNGRVFCNRSTDGGATWQPADTPLDVGSAPSAPQVTGLSMY